MKHAFFRRLETVYDFLSSDAFLRPYLESYLALAELFALIRNAYSDRPYLAKDLTAKTRELLRGQTESGALALLGAIHYLGPKELAALKGSGTTGALAWWREAQAGPAQLEALVNEARE